MSLSLGKTDLLVDSWPDSCDPVYAVATPSRETPSRNSQKTNFAKFGGTCMAVEESTWLLRGLRGRYGVYVPLFCARIALCGSYGTELREGVTVALFYS